MRRLVSIPVCAWLGVSALGLTSGCVAKECETEAGNDAVCLEAPERYDGSERSITRGYLPGTHVSVDGVYGNIEVVAGAEGEVTAAFRPFAYGAQNEDAAALEAIETKLVLSHELDGDTLFIDATRSDGDLPLVGADIEIALPPEFDGELAIVNRGNGTWNPGDVDVDFVGLAPSVEITAGALSVCELTGGPAVVYTSVQCESDVRVVDVSDEVDIEATGRLGSVELVLASVSRSTAGGSVRAGENVFVTFPAGSSFEVTAAATFPGVVDVDVPATCVSAVATESAQSFTCGDGGPLYELVAEGNVILELP